MNGPVVVTAATDLPITLAQAKAYAQIDTSDYDSMVTVFIKEAVDVIERRTGQQLMSATLEHMWDVFPCSAMNIYGMRLPGAPYGRLQSGRPFWPNDDSSFTSGLDNRLPWLTLDRRPVQSVTSVKYYDPVGTLTTLDTSRYYTDLNARPPRIIPVYGYPWPVTQVGRPASVVVRFVAGYALAADIPASLLKPVYALVSHFWKNREPVMTSGAIPKVMPYLVDDILDLHNVQGYR